MSTRQGGFDIDGLEHLPTTLPRFLSLSPDDQSP